MITPKRKKAAKALARRFSMTLSNECLADQKTRQYTLSNIGRIVRTEIKKMSTVQSILCSQSPDDLKNFKWSDIYTELKEKAPVFLGILVSATKTRSPRSRDNQAVICICVAILLKYRFKRLSLVQKIVSLILYNGHCSKKVYFMYCYHIHFMYVSCRYIQG